MATKRFRLLPRNKWLRGVIIFLFAWILIHAIYITVDGMNENVTEADVAIILGNRVYEDGSLANWTQGRVDRALQLYKEGKIKMIFASGGISRESNYPEGTAMKAYLVKNGVPDSAVIADDHGDNTFLTAKNFLAWNAGKKFKKVVIVSQFYHITRSVYILKKAGYDGEIQKASSKAYEFRDITGTLREIPAFYKYMLVY